MSLRGLARPEVREKTTEAISLGVGKKEIVTLPSVARNDRREPMDQT